MRSGRSIPCLLLPCCRREVCSGEEQAHDRRDEADNLAGWLNVLSWKDAHRGREQSYRSPCCAYPKLWVLDGPLLLRSHIPAVGPRNPPMVPSRAIIANLTNLHADTRPGNDAIYEDKEAPQKAVPPVEKPHLSTLELAISPKQFAQGAISPDKAECRPAPRFPGVQGQIGRGPGRPEPIERIEGIIRLLIQKRA